MYDATALMPIRARVLRRPASKAATRPVTASSGVTVSAPRVPASSAASSIARRGWTAVAPTARTMAIAWTSRMSTALTATSVRPRRPAAVRAVWTAPTARIDGTGSRSTDQPASVTSTTEVSRRAAATASVASRSRAASSPAGPGARIPGRVERPDRGPVGTDRGDEPVHVDDDRSCQAHGPWPARRPAEESRPPAELDPQVHDDALALRVDRRVRDLGEGLAEVVGDGSVEPRTAGRRRVVAHAPERLVRLERHRLDVEAGAFGVEAGEVAHHVVGGVVPAARRRHESVLVDRPRGVVDREGAEGAGLRLGVLEDRPAARLDQQQLARPEPATPDGLGRAERHGARLGGDGHEPVARHGEGGGSQPVPVDQRADGPAVGEDDGRRPVPRREEPGRPAAQRGDVRMRCAPERQRFGDRGQERGRQVPAGRRQELEALVERERIGAVVGQERTGGEERPRDLGRGGVAGAAAHLLAIAADRVDLAVVRDRAERLGEPPDGPGVRRVALVEDRVARPGAGRAGPGTGRAAGRR